MTPALFDRFLLGSMGVCAVGALFNLFLLKRRGTSALLMALAFVMLGFTIELYRSDVSKVLVGVGAVAVIGLLIADFVFRQSQPRSGR